MDSQDKRFQGIHLTDRSKDLKTSLIEDREQANEEVVRDLTLEEKALLKRLLRDVQG